MEECQFEVGCTKNRFPPRIGFGQKKNPIRGGIPPRIPNSRWDYAASGTAREMPHADDFFEFGDMLVTPVGSGRYVEKGTRIEYLGAVFRGSVLVREARAPISPAGSPGWWRRGRASL